MWKGTHAVPYLVHVLLALLPAVAPIHGEPQYVVLVPSELHTETPEKTCLHLHHLNETVTVRASLQSGWENRRQLFSDLVVDKDMFHCVSFIIPRFSPSDLVVILSVHIEGPTHKYMKRSLVHLKNRENIIFVQTEKPIYKPGQSVKFRVVSVDKKLHLQEEMIPLIYIEDPKMNRTMQWRNINTEHGLKELSFALSSEPILGPYKIVIPKQFGEKMEHSFTVEEHVRPKFEVQVKIPDVITILEDIMNMTVCGMYTYGKPVPGHVAILTIYIYSSWDNGKILQFNYKEDKYQLDNDGCITQVKNISEFLLNKRYEIDGLHVKARVTEEGTGVEVTGSGRTKVTRTVTKLEFVKVDSHFRHGIPFLVKVRLVNVKDVPIPNEQVFITSVNTGYKANAITDEHGLAEFSINTTDIMDPYLTIRVYHKEQSPCFGYPCLTELYGEAHHKAYRVFSSSKSYVYLETEPGVLPCGQTHTVQAHFTLNGQVLGELRELVFYYLVVAKGSIIENGTHTSHMEPGELKGDFGVEIAVDISMAPIAQMVIYAILPDGEIIADTTKFDIEKCLPNKVDLSFSPAQSLPSSQVHLRITTSPQSLCALRAVDQSTLLLKSETKLSPSWIYNLPGMQHTAFIPAMTKLPEDKGDCVKNDARPADKFQSTRKHQNEKDFYSYVEDMGLKVFTNLKTHHPLLCLNPESFPILVPLLMYDNVPIRKTYVDSPTVVREDPLTEAVRKYFPETWIWDLVMVNSSGVAELGVTVPDTITEWKARALCLSKDTGLGLSPMASLRAFQPFFVELTMPYSVVRGEVFTLKATVMNFLPKCIRVSVQLEASRDFDAVREANAQDSYCICTSGRHTASWAVTPKSLGNVNFSVTAEARQSLELCGSEAATVPETGRKHTVVKSVLVECQSESSRSPLKCTDT